MTEEPDRSEYLETRTEYTAGEHSSSRSYDRTLVALASSALGASLLLLGNLDKPKATWLLVLSWMFLVAAMAATLWSMHDSANAFRLQRDRLDEWYEKNDDSVFTRPNPAEQRVACLNVLSLGTFVLGVAGLLWFAAYNLAAR